jgi:hypothetical protein
MIYGYLANYPKAYSATPVAPPRLKLQHRIVRYLLSIGSTAAALYGTRTIPRPSRKMFAASQPVLSG